MYGKNTGEIGNVEMGRRSSRNTCALDLSASGWTRKSKAQVTEAPERPVVSGVKDVRTLLNKIYNIKAVNQEN